MTQILNEQQTNEALQLLRDKLEKVAPLAAKALNEHQPLGVNPKVGVVATVIGMSAAAGVQKAVIAKRTAGFFANSVISSFKAARKAYRELDSAYETMVRNMKAGSSNAPDKKVVEALKEAVEAHKLDIQNQ
jgi:hypothetical protein